jgi:hypothetical protein
LTTGCVRPLGPGFRFLDRKTEIRAVAGAPDRLHVRVVDSFANIGDRPLRSIEVRLPEGPDFGSQNLRVSINGRTVSPQQTSDVDSRTVRAPFDPVWEQPQPREIVTEWDLAPGLASSSAAASAVAFYIADATALPLWQAPSGPFASGGPNPREESLTVFAPPDFRVLAPGKPLKGGTQGGVVAHSFRIQPLLDFPPYVIAGRYQEQRIVTPQGVVIFWTFQLLDTGTAQTAALRLASSMRAFTDYFGPASKGESVVRIVEAPGDLPAEFGEPGDPGGASFPGGVLLDRRAFAQGIANEAALELAEYKLAQTWFGWGARPRTEAQTLMGRGLGLFSWAVAAETRDPNARRRMAAFLLERYNQAQPAAADTRLIEPPSGYSHAERITAGYKAALFFIALEDLCGRDNLRAALTHIVKARGGDDTNEEDLRAAVEAASQRDLAGMFRIWLNHPGIPDEFRARYSSPPSMRSGN